MENTTNNSFEEQWQRAFDDASLLPSDAVWENVELGLGNGNIPSKSGNGSYYVGGAIMTVILGFGIWFFSYEKETIKSSQIIENQEFKQEKKIEKVVLGTVEKNFVKSKEIQAIQKVIIPKKEEEIVITEFENVVQEPENQERIITDSIDFISPKISTKNMSTDFENQSIEMPFQATPYYEKPMPKPQKKSIWNKVRISGGVGVY